jgi:cyclohexanone monooxygenase
MKQSQSAKAPLRPAYDAIVVGAGFAGLYMVHTLRGLGLSVHCFEAGDEVGGTWYWNRYPGARCDVESQQYSFSFCKEIEDEWIWTERYSGQPEILSYLKFVADRLDLRKDISLGTRVTAAIYDDTSQLWSVSTATGESVHAQHLYYGDGLPFCGPDACHCRSRHVQG